MKSQIPTCGITVREIAEAEGLSKIYVHRLTQQKGFPEPMTRIGRNLIFDHRQVNKFFRDREKNKAA